MKLTARLTVAALLLLSTACASEQPTYGPTTAGATKASTPSAESVIPPSLGEPARPAARKRAVGSVCKLFTNAEIAKWLGLRVRKGTLTEKGRYQTCSWKAVDAPVVPSYREGDPVLQHDDGIVSITRGRAGDYAGLRKRVTAAAVAKGAAGSRQDLPRIGGDAFAIGDSVNGVPLWSAMARTSDSAIAVEVSGAGSRSSTGIVSAFLSQTLARL